MEIKPIIFVPVLSEQPQQHSSNSWIFMFVLVTKLRVSVRKAKLTKSRLDCVHSIDGLE
jgi:hypothetical protein